MLKASILLVAIVTLLEISFPITANASILETKHNLSVSGNFTVRAISETRVCVFCHTPHNANPDVPLWSHTSTTPVGGYTPYQSSTMEASSAQPDGASKLCLSCHDGTIAVGSLPGRTVSMTGVDADGSLLPEAVTDLGADLTNDHPVSIVPVPGIEIQNPPMGSSVRLDATGKVQCTSCHNPHDNSMEPFLVKSRDYGQLCTECHLKTGWVGSVHATSKAVITLDSTTKVMDQWSCLGCHAPHTKSDLVRLVNPGVANTEEAVCLRCHNLQATDISTPITKVSRHEVEAQKNVHDPRESFGQLSDLRHIECADCHEPHQVRSGLHAAESSDAGPTLNGIIGLKPTFPTTPWQDLYSTDFTPVEIANDGLAAGVDSLEAYVCFQCHPTVAKEVNPNNAAIHNVIGLDIVPYSTKENYKPLGYVEPYGPDTKLTCTDCHGTDVGNVGQGPHGSVNANLLQRPADITDTRDSNLICFKCHIQDVYTFYGNSYDRDGLYTYFKNSSYSAHTKYHGTKNYINCFTCHSAVPHGFKRSQFIVYVTDEAPYYNAELVGTTIDGTGEPNGIYGWRKKNPGYYYTKQDCWAGCKNPTGNGTYYYPHPYNPNVQYEP